MSFTLPDAGPTEIVLRVTHALNVNGDVIETRVEREPGANEFLASMAAFHYALRVGVTLHGIQIQPAKENSDEQE